MSWVSAAISATVATVGAIKSFSDADKQKQAMDDADSAAAAMMKSARGALEVNYYKELAIQKEPYELQREASLAAGAQAIEAGREGDVRGVGATAGRVQMAQEQAQAQARAAMSQEMSQLEKITAQEESRLRDIGVQLDLSEAEGAQQASADAAKAMALAQQQGFEQLSTAATTVGAAIPVYQKTKGVRDINKAQRKYRRSDEAKLGMSFHDYSLSQADQGKGILAGLDYGEITSEKAFNEALWGVGGLADRKRRGWDFDN